MTRSCGWQRCHQGEIGGDVTGHVRRQCLEGEKKPFPACILTGLGPQDKPDTSVLGREKEMIAIPSTNKQELSTITSIFCGTFRNKPIPLGVCNLGEDYKAWTHLIQNMNREILRQLGKKCYLPLKERKEFVKLKMMRKCSRWQLAGVGSGGGICF